MCDKVSRVIKISLQKLKLGKKLQVRKIPNLSFGTKLRAKDGKLILGNVKTTGVCEFSAYSGLIEIGNGVSFNRNALIVSLMGIKIGDGCAFGPNVTIYDHNHKFDENGIAPGYTKSVVEIGKNCWIGAGSIILKNAKIGDGCVIGAGCVINEEIPPHSLVTSGRGITITPIVGKKESK